MRKMSEETKMKNKIRSREWDEKNKEAKNRRNKNYEARKRKAFEDLKERIDNLEKYISVDFSLDI